MSAGPCSYCGLPAIGQVTGHGEQHGETVTMQRRAICGSCAIRALDLILREAPAAFDALSGLAGLVEGLRAEVRELKDRETARALAAGGSGTASGSVSFVW